MTERYKQKTKNSAFPNELKNPDISLVYKKKDHHDKSNYRPVSIRILYKQINNFKYQQEFQKKTSSQNSSLAMIG